jgi:hypothetical protein
VLVARYIASMALDELTKSGNSCADRGVDVLPIMKELIIRHARLLCDAVDQFDHASDPSVEKFNLRAGHFCSNGIAGGHRF